MSSLPSQRDMERDDVRFTVDGFLICPDAAGLCREFMVDREDICEHSRTPGLQLLDHKPADSAHSNNPDCQEPEPPADATIPYTLPNIAIGRWRFAQQRKHLPDHQFGYSR